MNKKTIITSILLIVLCLSLISGSTYALFTSESQVNIAVTSGKVDVKANLSINSIYSAVAAVNGTLYDENNNKYSHVQQTNTDMFGRLQFLNLGTAYLDTRGVLNLDRITPGDKVVVVLSVTNNSNVSAKYRLKIEVPDSSKELAQVLITTIGTTEYKGLSKYKGIWTDLEIGQNPMYSFTIEMPMDAGNIYQDLSSDMVITVEAVQGNVTTNDELLIETFTAQSSKKSTYLSDTGSTVINTSISPANNGKNTTVALYNVGAANAKSTLDISTSGLETNYENTFNISGNNVENVVGTIGFDLTIGDVTTNTFSPGYAIISTYIVKGLENVDIIYSGADTTLTFGLNGARTRVNTSENEVDSPGEYYYDKNTGLLVFATDHFSEYLINTSDEMKVYVPELNKVYVSLNAALGEVAEKSTLLLLDDIVLVDDFFPTKEVTIKGKSIMFDKSDTNVLTSRPIWISTASGKTNVFKDMTIKGIQGDYTFGVNQCDIDLTNVKIISEKNTAFYQQFGTATLNNVTIINTGLYDSNTNEFRDSAITVAISGTVIVNGGTYKSENGYAVYINQNGGTVTINGGTFDGKICANIDRTTYENRESHIIINNGTFTNSNFSTTGGEYATIVITGGTFDSDPSSFVDLDNYDVTNISGLYVVTEKVSN